MIPFVWLEQAQDRLSGRIKKTSLTYDPYNDLYIKWENQQITGSFKVRGAINKVFSLQDWERQRGIITASAGNHGQGVALAGKIVNAPVMVFVPENAVPAKLAAIRSLGAELRLVPGGYADAETAGLSYAAAQNATWISPYNDGFVIAGQGTLGFEILQDLPLLPQVTWIIPVGGGGLLAGIGSCIRAPEMHLAEQRLVGVQSSASPFMRDLFYTGSQESTIELPSLADGLAGAVEKDSITIPLVRKTTDEIVLVEEGEIVAAIRYGWERYGERIEGSGAAALAAVLYGKVPQRPAVVVISGGNIQPELHAQIIAGEG